jgi:CheY-like chemotaxis protein
MTSEIGLYPHARAAYWRRRGISVEPGTPGRKNIQTILVLDDEPINLNFLSLALRAKGFRVLEADSAAEALRLSAESREPIDLLVADYVLADGWGTEVAQKTRERRPDIAVLLISGTPVEGWRREELEKFVRLGDKADFLAKPFPVDALYSKIQGLAEIGRP